jgi:hypothetical protein
MPTLQDLVQFFQHAGADVAGTMAAFFAFILITSFRGYWHTDREFQREVDRGDAALAIATQATENTKKQQDQIESLTDVVEHLTEQLGRRAAR